MPSLRLILHGKAAYEPTIRAAVEQLRAAGHEIDVRVTWEGGQAAHFAQEAANLGIDIVVAGGGDGTINEAVNGLMSVSGAGATSSLPLCIVPLGTANVLAREIGQESRAADRDLVAFDACARAQAG